MLSGNSGAAHVWAPSCCTATHDDTSSFNRLWPVRLDAGVGPEPQRPPPLFLPEDRPRH
jgi:hypothetical protein